MAGEAAALASVGVRGNVLAGLTQRIEWIGADTALPNVLERVLLCRWYEFAEGYMLTTVEEGQLREGNAWWSRTEGYVDDVVAWARLPGTPPEEWMEATRKALDKLREEREHELSGTL